MFGTSSHAPSSALLTAFVIFLLAGLAVVILVGVACRKLGISLVWYDEVASIMLAWLTYYGAALAALKRAHIGFPAWSTPCRRAGACRPCCSARSA